jgi:acyl carrier protein
LFIDLVRRETKKCPIFPSRTENLCFWGHFRKIFPKIGRSGNALNLDIVLSSEYSLKNIVSVFTLLPMTSSMTSTSTLQHPRATALIQHLSADLRVPGNRLQAFTRLREDLFLDTMDIELLIASLERNLEYYLTEEEAAQIETVGDLQTFFLR